MADLGDRLAQLGHALALLQRRGHGLLHRLQRGFGIAQFGQPGVGGDDVARILGRLGVGHHVADDAADRHQDQPLHGEVQQNRRQDREGGRQQQQAQAEVDHAGPQRLGFHRDLDQLARLVDGGADDPDHLVPAIQKGAQCVVDGLDHPLFSQVIGLGHRSRKLRLQDKLPDVVAPQDDVEDPGILQQFRFQVVGQRFVRCQHRKAGDLPAFQPRFEIVQPEAGQCRKKDQHFGKHDEDDRQCGESARDRIQFHVILIISARHGACFSLTGSVCTSNECDLSQVPDKG